MMKRLIVCALLAVMALGAVALADDVVSVQKILDASNALQTFSATIMMTQYSGKKASTIEFQFTYVPPTKMRIEYTAPKALVGQLLIINGDQLYTYMPALHRSLHRTVSGDGGDEGKEMGFLYYFVNRSLSEFLQAYTISPVDGPEKYTYEYNGKEVSYNACKLELIGEDGKQIVWCDAASLVPIAIDIYDGDTLAIEIRVVDYEYNGIVPEAAFVIPD